MFANKNKKENYLNCNDLITKAMIKRRRLAAAAISNICNKEQTLMRVVK